MPSLSLDADVLMDALDMIPPRSPPPLPPRLMSRRSVRCLMDLPSELIGYILSMLNASQVDLYHAALVSKQLYMHAMPLLWSEPFISDPTTLSRFMAYMNKPPSMMSNSTFRNGENGENEGGFKCGHWVRNLYLDNNGILDAITPDVIRQVLASAAGENLRRLDLTRCILLTDDTFIDLLDEWKLRSGIVDANGDIILPDRSSTHTADVSVRGPLSKLTAISLAGCGLLTDRAMRALFPLIAHSNLTILNLNRVHLITDETLRLIPSYFPHLRGLSINGCPYISDDALSSCICSLSGALTELSVTDCPRISNGTLEALGSHASKLTYIRMTGCHLVSDTGVVSMVKGCRKLEYVFLGKCQISDSSIRSFVNYCPCHHRPPTPPPSVYTNHFPIPVHAVSDNVTRGSREEEESDLCPFSKLPLSYLDVAYSSAISLSSLYQLSRHAPKLQSLGLGACRNLLASYPWLTGDDIGEKVPDVIPEHLRSQFCVIRGVEKIKKFRERANEELERIIE